MTAPLALDPEAWELLLALRGWPDGCILHEGQVTRAQRLESMGLLETWPAPACIQRKRGYIPLVAKITAAALRVIEGPALVWSDGRAVDPPRLAPGLCIPELCSTTPPTDAAGNPLPQHPSGI